MNKKIFKTILLISISVMMATIVCIMIVLQSYIDRSLNKEFKYEANYISKGYEQGGLSYLDSLPVMDNRITVIGKDGRVSYDNKTSIATMNNHNNRPEVVEAREKGVGSSERTSKTFSEKRIYYAIRLPNDEVLRLSIAKSTVLSLLYGIFRPILIIFCVMTIIAFFLAHKLAKKIVTPINSIDFDDLKAPQIYDELHPLITRIRNLQGSIKKQKDDLMMRELEFKLITENMKEGLVIIDKSMTMISLNDSAKFLLGNREAVAGESVLALNRGIEFQRLIKNILAGNGYNIEVKVGQTHCYIIGSPSFDKKGRLVGGVLVIIDNTEVARREALRREFSANVSHELKTPLTSISGFAEIMKAGIVKTEDIEEFATNIYKEAQRMIDLVNDIIKLSQLDEKIVIGEVDNINLENIINQVAEDLSEMAKLSKVKIKTSLKECYIQGNEKNVYTIIYNLVENAIKYSEIGKEVVVSTLDKGFRVADEGIGIEISEQNRIFERFYRVDKGRSKEIQGTGLGLSIVKNALAIEGGVIEVQSELGKGTSMTVIFTNK